MEPEELTELALASAVKAGAGYADARWVRQQTEGLTVTDDRVDDTEAEDSSGLGVRVLVDGRWGFAASAVVDPGRAGDLARRAVEVARASAALGGEPVRLAPAEPAVASWSTPVARDPFAVPLAERVALLLARPATPSGRCPAWPTPRPPSTCGGGARSCGRPRAPA